MTGRISAAAALAVALVAIVLAVAGDAAAQVDGYSREAIRDYQARVVVEKDGGVLVTEDIEVVALGQEIRRGIFRDVPLGRSSMGLGSGADFELVQTLRDGQPETSRVERSGGDVRIYLGRSDVFLKPGIYRYRIVYRMSDQAGRFGDFDEIYWNVTGNEWAFPIEHAEATVVLPPGAPVQQVAAYTGYAGSRAQDAIITETDAGVVFRTARALAPGEGLTVAVGWPEGYLDPLTPAQRFRRFMDRWGSLALAGVTIGVVLLYYLIVWWRVGRDPKPGTIIPVYHPTLPPAAMRFIENMGSDTTCFTAAVLNLAVKGHVKIEEDSDGKQTLTAVDDDAAARPMSAGEEAAFDALFVHGDTVKVQRKSKSVLRGAVAALSSHLNKTFNAIYFRRNGGWFALGMFLTLIGWLAVALLSARTPDGLIISIFVAVFTAMFGGVSGAIWDSVRLSLKSGKPGQVAGAVIGTVFMGSGFFVMMGVMTVVVGGMGIVPLAMLVSLVVLNIVFFRLLKQPTAIGRAALDEIEGTRLYLTVAEEDRLKFHNPPDRTPEHFHELLPYAIALDVETGWTGLFKAQIEAAQRQGDTNPYLSPSWYRGSSGGGFSDVASLNSLGSGLGSALSSATASSSSSSGSGGGGSSGGGGGGGGGGGW